MKKLLPIACLFALACQESPLGPDMSPQFLIGQSPLSPIQLVPNPDPAQPPLLDVPVLVNRGIAQVAVEDKFVIRLTAEFKVANCTVCAIGPQDTGIAGQKDAGVRQGSDVAIGACIEIPANVWDVIKSESQVPVEVVAELVMVTGSGSETILDSVLLSGIVYPTGIS